VAGTAKAPAIVNARNSALRAIVGSLALHVLVGVALLRHRSLPNEKQPADPVELSIVQAPETPASLAVPTPEPPSPPVPTPPTKPKPAERPPRVVKAQSAPPLVPLPSAATEPVKPVFGVSAESLTDDAKAASAPLGNTVATAPAGVASSTVEAKAPTSTLGGAPGGTGSTSFAPVSESFVQQWPRTLEEIQAPYPEEARRVDMRGTVRLRIGIDETGRVREVKLIKRVGFGLDEAATKAMWKFRFSPAIGQDGRPVPFRINYNYVFNPPS
jgi:periplasmic protein TonB